MAPKFSPVVLPLAAGVLATLAFAAHPADAAGPSAAGPRAADTVLVGTLRLAPGSCAGGKVTGTYFRMILPSGSQNGPYMSNSDSRCSDQSFTPLSPGTDGGLRVGSYQPIPSPAFASDGNARANRITSPAAFYGTSFATATNPTDPQSKAGVPAPRVTLAGSTLTADLRSFSVTWNNQHFNQGAPKPDGSQPGSTRIGTGTYDARTGAFTLDWTSQIVGGPFDKFTGKWHLEGRFVPDQASAPGGSTGTTSGKPGGSNGTAPGKPGGSNGATGSGPAAVPGAVAPLPAAVPVAPAAGVDPIAAGVPVSGSPAAPPATTHTVTKQNWSVSWPVVGLAGGLAALGFGALVALTVTGRTGGVA